MGNKILSGRWYLTIITGIIFAFATFKGILNSEAVATIITMVMISYFQRADRNGGSK